MLRAYPKEFGAAVAAVAEKLMKKLLAKPATQFTDTDAQKAKDKDKLKVDRFFKDPIDDFWEDALLSA